MGPKERSLSLHAERQRARFQMREHCAVHAFSRPRREPIRLPGLAWRREIRWPVASAMLDGEALGLFMISGVLDARYMGPP